MSTTLDDLQDRWPVFSSILVDYFAASPGARRGRKGDDATFLTRFSAVGGEKSPEFNGLHAELTGLIQRPGEASDLLNLTFGYVDATGSPLALALGGPPLSDEIAIVFCGTKKSLATGVPMATVLFAGQAVGLIVFPLMVFHTLQLIACTIIAQRYAATDSVTNRSQDNNS